jgi:hypothetical protein
MSDIPVQAGLHGADMLAEPQHHAELFGLHAEETGKPPDRQGDHEDKQDSQAADEAAWHQRLQAILSAPQKIFKIRRPGPGRLRSRAPRTLGA